MDKSILLDWYRQMVLIRRFEERCDELYQLEGKIKGFLHLYIGQEAIAVGTIAARNPHDHVITAYRDHGHALAVGTPPGNVMAELMGKATGCTGGRGGSMHLVDPARHFWGGHGIVGAHLSIATGLALADQYRKNNGATLCYFGDGATNIGYFHESFNLSRVWDLPVLWICENNKYGMGTSIERASAAKTIVQKAAGYDIPGKQVDGMDVQAIYEETKAALERVRNGGGPELLEMMTYRYSGHSIGDRTMYRPKEELAHWRDERDPIQRLQSILGEQYGMAMEAFQEIDQSVRDKVEEAVQFANESPLPGFETLYNHVYVEEVA